MKKTLLVTIDYPPSVGGVATYLEQVVQSFPAEKMIVLTLKGEQPDTDQVIRKKLFFAWIWPKWLKGVYEIYKVYKQQNCEQILVGQVLPVGSMVWVLHLFFKIPYIVQIYGMDLLQTKESKRKQKLVKAILHRSKFLLVNSQAVRDIARDFSDDASKIEVIYPIPKAFPKSNKRVEAELEKKYQLMNKKIILTVGRLVKRKGQDSVLGAMTHLWQMHPECVYVIVGDGPDRSRLEKMALPHREQVIFTGQVSNEERDAWFHLADLFCMPAKQYEDDIEGYGIVYLEANAAGKAVIAGDQGGPKEAIIHEKTGLLVNPDDIDEIAKALLRLIEDPKLAEKLGQNGQERLSSDLTWKRQSDILEKVLA